ncbi:DUF4031 domain-containing protein [uncultured Acinetobacter sp.]|uniref:DUF4031 domain-containing protein n=1 Tax=uncultured Acinetobacter sp. TaxID=165433 RepID=UPI0025DAD155|nr:DUF4031 domain-containing protein [uncultured Acinetobacter sp.]
MAVYVDRAKVPFKGKEWCHMMADTLEELHDFARTVGIDPRLFHRSASYPHYDITLEMRILVIAYGAIDADRKTIIMCGKKLKMQLTGIE